MNPLEELVSAAKNLLDDVKETCDCIEVDPECPLTRMSDAIASIERAEVETLWEVISKYTLPNVHSFFKEQEARDYYDSLWPDKRESYSVRIVQITTIRSVVE